VIGDSDDELYEPLMDDNESNAISDLLAYLENVPTRFEVPLNYHAITRLLFLLFFFFFNVSFRRRKLIVQQCDREFFDNDVLRSLNTLVYSNGIQLQRTAALAFAEITEKGISFENNVLTIDVRVVDRETLEPLLFLLQSPDEEVQRASSAALGNLAVNGNANA
jgi:vacuolar protein 8